MDPTDTPTATPSATLTPTSSPTATLTPTNTPTFTPTPYPTIFLSLDNIPPQVQRGQDFPITLILSHGAINTDYYLKAYGGVSDNYSIEVFYNGIWSNGYNGAWVNMPKFRSNQNGEINENITLRSKSDQSGGTYNLTGKIKEVNSDNSVTSSTRTILVATPTSIPTNTPTATKTPTPTTITFTTAPTATPTPRPTSTPIPPLSPVPTFVLPTDSPVTATPVKELIETPSPTAGEILGLEDLVLATPTPAPIVGKISPPPLSIILIVLGGLFLLIPIIFTQLHR